MSKSYTDQLLEQTKEDWKELHKMCKALLEVQGKVPLEHKELHSLLETVSTIGYILQYPYPEFGKLLVHATLAVANTHNAPETIMDTRELFAKMIEDIMKIIHNSGEGGQLQ